MGLSYSIETFIYFRLHSVVMHQLMFGYLDRSELIRWSGLKSGENEWWR